MAENYTEFDTVIYTDDNMEIIKYNLNTKLGYQSITDCIRRTYYKVVSKIGATETLFIDNRTFNFSGHFSINNNFYEIIKKDYLSNGPNLISKAVEWKKCSSKEKNIIYDIISSINFYERKSFFNFAPQMARYHRIDSIIDLYDTDFLNSIWDNLSKDRRLKIIKDIRFNLSVTYNRTVSKNEAQILYKLRPKLLKTITEQNYRVIKELSNKQKIKIINEMILTGPNKISPYKADISSVAKTLSLKYILKIFSASKALKYVDINILNNIIPSISEKEYNKIMDLL
jgi:hypothetical protein